MSNKRSNKLYKFELTYNEMWLLHLALGMALAAVGKSAEIADLVNKINITNPDWQKL